MNLPRKTSTLYSLWFLKIIVFDCNIQCKKSKYKARANQGGSSYAVFLYPIGEIERSLSFNYSS